MSILVKNLASLWVGALILLTTGRIGLPGLCNLISAFRFGARGLFCVRNFDNNSNGGLCPICSPGANQDSVQYVAHPTTPL